MTLWVRLLAWHGELWPLKVEKHELVQRSQGNLPRAVTTEPIGMKMMNFVLPNGAEYFISLQRTQYQSSLMKTVRKLLPADLVNGPVLRIIEKYRREKISSMYYADMAHEFQSIEAFVNPNTTDVLDIGCGIGGINVLFWQKLKGNVELSLMDKTRTDAIYYGFKSDAAFYNDFGLTGAFLVANGVDRKKISFYEAGKGHITAIGKKFHLIVSLISWGFHYPLDYYLEEALAALKSDGCIILDLRTGSGDLEGLRMRNDCTVQVIADFGKYMRIRISSKPQM